MPLSLRVLGGIRVLDGPVELAWTTTQKMRAALLVYLALEGRATRDQLLSVFWPELSDERARHALRQLLYSLRQSIGDDRIVTAGDVVRCADVACDAVEFADLVERGELAAAIALYEGEFLGGAHLCETSGFENWADRQRARLQRLHRRAQRAQMQALLAADDHAAALGAARRWVDVEPTDDEAQQHLIQLLASSGDRAGALRQYELYTRVLAEAELEPLPELVALVESLRSEPAETGVGPLRRGAQLAQDTRGAARPFRRWALRRRIAVAAVGALAFTLAAWSVGSLRHEGDALEDDLVAVMPFRVNGADSSLSEGLLDLVAARLTGSGGPHAVYPDDVIRSIRAFTGHQTMPSAADARRITRELGARWMWRGSVASTGSTVTLTLAVEDLEAGALPAVTVEGPADSLAWLVERLVGHALARSAGEPDERVRSPITTSLPALTTYLEGRRSLRRGDFRDAHDAFSHALELDSAFAHAALGLAESARWASRPMNAQTLQLAAGALDRFSPEDRALATVLIDVYTNRATRPLQESVDTILRALEAAPRRPLLWFELGDLYAHFGAWLGDPESARAKAAFGRALAIDSLEPRSLLHRFEIAASEADTVAAIALHTRYVRHAGDGEMRPYLDWRMAHLRGDSAAVRSARGHFGAASRVALLQVVHMAQADGVGLEDARVAGDVLLEGSATPREAIQIIADLRSLALNRGRPSEALRYHRMQYDLQRAPVLSAVLVLRDALYADGDRPAAAAAARALSTALDTIGSDAPPIALQGLCLLEEWRLSHGDTSTVGPSLSLLGRARALRVSDAQASPVRCALVVAALREQLRAPPAARAAQEELRAFALHFTEEPHDNLYQLRLAQLELAAGNDSVALAAVERYPYGLNTIGLATHRLLEARLASRLGRFDQAVKAYRHYLALRAEPEPVLIPERDSARAELRALLARGANRSGR